MLSITSNFSKGMIKNILPILVNTKRPLSNGEGMLSMNYVREKLKEMLAVQKYWHDQGRSPSKEDETFKLPKDQKELPVRKVSESYREAFLPLGTDSAFREKYINFYNKVRFGRIMEDLDSMAVWISYSHNAPLLEKAKKAPVSIVTAMVDRIDMLEHSILADRDMKIRGHVSWVGRSSMEITMNVSQETENGNWAELLIAKFVMVARDVATKKAAVVCPLLCETDEEKKLFEVGEALKNERQQDAKISLFKSVPTPDESKSIHELFLNTLDLKKATLKARVLPPNGIWMEETKLKTVIVCHPEERNLYNKIFGGFLMRQAYELAWANACLYCKTRPMAVAVDDIFFIKPVEIGSLLFLSSQIVYTEGSGLQLMVNAEVVQPWQGIHETTNTFHFTFKSADGDVPVVVPKSYGESMMYISGKRHFMKALKRHI